MLSAERAQQGREYDTDVAAGGGGDEGEDRYLLYLLYWKALLRSFCTQLYPLLYPLRNEMGSQFTHFTGIKVRILTLQCLSLLSLRHSPQRDRDPAGTLVYSLYLLQWCSTTNNSITVKKENTCVLQNERRAPGRRLRRRFS